jgi:hypothetical protein
MDLVDLIVLVCSLAHPTLCAEKHMLFQSSGSLDACMMQAQPYLAQWIGAHPNVRVMKFHCAYPQAEKQGI